MLNVVYSHFLTVPLRDLNKVLKEKFSGETIGISDEVRYKLNNGIFSTAGYSDIILKGAKTIDCWGYNKNSR